MPSVNEEVIEPGLPNAPVNSYGVSCRDDPKKWTPRGCMLVYVVAIVHYGYHSVAQLSAIPSTAHTLHVDERLQEFFLLMRREVYVVVII